MVPVGNPGLPVSTNVRRHNRSLGPAKGAILGAADLTGMFLELFLLCHYVLKYQIVLVTHSSMEKSW